MAEKFASRRNIDFMLHEVLKAEELTQYDLFRDHSRETFDMMIDTLWKMADESMFPLFQEMDINPPQYSDGTARVHPFMPEFMKQCGQGGWINAAWPYDRGGQQVPNLVNEVFSYVMGAANSSMAIFLSLTTGAANLILNFGTAAQKDLYLPKMTAGIWQGTMALTEPDAGSSLADITTSAEDSGLGHYLIQGKKIFISAGDTTATENTIHLLLAKIKGAPAGVKGISLFIVPKFRFSESGSLECNDLTCTGIEHKMGAKGEPACQISMGDQNDCFGYLVGKPNMGLSYMFQMMNEARIGTGIIAAAKATASYYACLEYTKQRLQGRKPGQKDPASKQIPIIEHADIRRLLLFQLSVTEGGMSLALQLSKYLDLARAGIEREKHELLVDFLVPIVKTFPSEYGILSTSAAMQCLGGYGFCRDFPVEQYFRDIRIDAILEGSTGIQGIDLLGRKVTMKKGQAYKLFIAEVKETVAKAKMISEISSGADELARGLGIMEDVTAYLLEVSERHGAEEFLADASLYLEMAGIVAIGWQWLLQGIAAQNALPSAAFDSDKNFYDRKLQTLRYFMTYELAKVDGLARTLKNSHGLTANMNTSIFGED